MGKGVIKTTGNPVPTTTDTPGNPTPPTTGNRY